MSEALLLVGHGSHLSADSSAPVLQLAAVIRELHAFAEVGVAFWKEEPSLPRAFDQFQSDSITVVPVFISEGYFTRQVIPRELRLAGPSTERDGLRIRYTAAIGSHPNLTSLIIERAEEAGALPADTVVVLGHGTPQNANSERNIIDRADEVRALGRFASVHALFLEQDPNIVDVFDLVDGERIIVVPFFIADGWHVGESIPEDLAITDGAVHRGTRSLYYAKPVGTHPRVRETVLELAGVTSRSGAAPPAASRWKPPAHFGQLTITIAGDSATIEGPTATEAGASCIAPAEAAALHQFLRFDDAGNYRPLSGATNMRSGWRIECAAGELLPLIEAAYPLATIHAAQSDAGTLRTASLAEVLGRQSGRYESARAITPASAEAAMTSLCGNCVRRPVWPSGIERADGASDSAAIPCPEPCSVLIELCREVQIFDQEPPEPAVVDSAVPFARFDLPGNAIRERYLRLRTTTMSAHDQ